MVRVFVLSAALLFGCATMEVSSDWDPEVDFSALVSYRWQPSSSRGDPPAYDSLIDARVRRAVDLELAARGYELRRAGGVDFVVNAFVIIEQRLDVHVLDDHYGYRPGWGSWDYGVGSRTYVREYEEGTLILDIADLETRKLLWRGTARAQVNRAGTPEESEAVIGKAVRRILERFPPERR